MAKSTAAMLSRVTAVRGTSVDDDKRAGTARFSSPTEGLPSLNLFAYL